MLKKHANKSSEFFEISLFVELLWKNPCIISRLEIGFELASNWLCIGSVNKVPALVEPISNHSASLKT